ESEQAAANQEQREHEAHIGVLEQERGEVDGALAEVSQGLTQALVEAGRSKERRAAAEEALRELHGRLQTLGQERESAANEAREAIEAIALARSELEATEQRERETGELLRQRRGAIDGLREQRQALRIAIDEDREARQGIQANIEALEEKRHERHTALREIEVRRENLVARVNEDLSLDLATLYHDYEHAEQDWAAIKEEIETLRQKITRLGNVNLDAIGELEELTPRYESLQTQRQDLLDSILQLEALIADLDQESRTRFAASFEEIRAHFQDLFRKLFGGGKADIILEDPEDPLECGIEIIARPPGKEPQTLSLLSGGEKTMAAVALLLAVFKSKPSPFAILDEVDAALDESNVGRFNTVVQEFVEHSQFLVVTHNKRTMQHADMLYGVTMEETGVSKRVSVRFDERVDTPNVA
ncbi:MAG: AAA family ATPase, partial [Phycisphaerae bacterium]|nr:AAA family ATPase [Phycisphaerae bacterium]